MKLIAKKPCSFGGRDFYINDEIPPGLVADAALQERMGMLAVVADPPGSSSVKEELSGLDSKKYQTILKFKSQLPDRPPEHILSENITAGNKQVDEYGELAVKHLTQTHREFNEDELQEIVSLYQAGKSTRKIGEMFGVCKTTIVNTLRGQGVNVTRSKVQAKLNADEVIAMYKNEITAEKIAKQFGVNPQTILNCLRSHGVKIRSRWDYKQE